MKPNRKRRRRVILTGIALLLTLAIGDYWLYPRLSIGGQSWNRGSNGIWLRYKWYFGENKDFQGLAKRLQDGQMRYAYFHVRFIKKDGTLHFRYPKPALELNRSLEKLCPNVQRVAWIYVGNKAGEGNVDISQPDVRTKMIQEAKWLVKTCGFDGIQWDYEICEDGNQDFLSLLAETRKAFPHLFVSAAVPSMQEWPVSGFSWSQSYAEKVAQHVDQIAIMGYDTGRYFPRLYANHLQYNVRQYSKAVGSNRRVILGIPTYWDGPKSHNPRAENIRMALKAIRNEHPRGNVEGVALFADYTTDPEEWTTYLKEWIEPRKTHSP